MLTNLTSIINLLIGKGPIKRRLSALYDYRDFKDLDARDIFLGKSRIGENEAVWRQSADWSAVNRQYLTESKDLMRRSNDFLNGLTDADDDRDKYFLSGMLKDTVAGGIAGVIGDIPTDDLREAVNTGDIPNIVPGFAGSAVDRLVNRDRIVGEWAQKLYVSDYGFDIVHDYALREGSFKFGNSEYFGGVGIGLEDGMVQNSWGARNTYVNQVFDERLKEIGTSVRVKDYHVGVDHSNVLRSSAVDVATRRVNASTLLQLEDRDFGQRIKVNGTEVAIRHDFDHYIIPDSSGQMATELYVNHKGLGVSAETNRRDQAGAVSIGLGGNSVGVFRAYGARASYVNVTAMDGWQWISTVDLPDEDSDRIWARTGFGKLNRFFGRFGTGIGEDGHPMLSADVQTRNLGFSSGYKKAGPRNVFLYSINVGNTVYSWESEVMTENIEMPPVLSKKPLIKAMKLLK